MRCYARGRKNPDGVLTIPFARYAPVIRELEHDFYDSDLFDYHYGDTASQNLFPIIYSK